jgi:hypothetical protein
VPEAEGGKMSDPVLEDAEYILIAGHGGPRVVLAQGGRLTEPGPVHVIWGRRLRRSPMPVIAILGAGSGMARAIAKTFLAGH